MVAKFKKIKITATAESPLRIGGPRDPIRGVDLPMATVAGIPVIPGTSLKGALRAQIEQYLSEIAKDNPDLRPCIPASKPSEAEKTLKGYRAGGACSCEEDTAKEGKTATETICPACYLLGAQGITGFIRVPFLTSSISQEELVGISIDRGRGVVRSGGNWNYEFVPNSTSNPTTFTGILEIILEDPSRGWKLGNPRPSFENQDRWLKNGDWTPERIENELIKKRLEAINVLGGFKSKGFGKVKIQVTPV